MAIVKNLTNIFSQIKFNEISSVEIIVHLVWGESWSLKPDGSSDDRVEQFNTESFVRSEKKDKF